MSAIVIIIGAGGHARVVADALLCAGQRVLGFVDRDAALHGSRLLGLPVLGGDEVLAQHDARGLQLANGIGGIEAGPSTRQQVQARLQTAGWRFVAVRHPRAVVSASAVLGEGCQLLACSVVQPGARIGQGSIVNTAAVVEHDCRIGSWTHIAPRALLCGDVQCGDFVHVGAGAVLRQGVRIGNGTLVAAGAVVVHDVHGGLVAGVPARTMERRI